MFRESIDNLRNFNLVLILEWIDSSSALLKDALDWEIPPMIVLPHEMQALRYGKAGQKDSLSAKIFLSTDVSIFRSSFSSFLYTYIYVYAVSIFWPCFSSFLFLFFFSSVSCRFMYMQEYKYLVQDNILDILFFYVTKRIYLERLHKCKYHKI